MIFVKSINNLKLNSTQSVLNHSSGYKFLVVICMIYMSITLCNAILTNRYIGYDRLFILGGTLTSPFVFILDDIIAEIYGYKIARCTILTGYASQTIFVIICQLVLMSPSPSHFKYAVSYTQILGGSLLRINISGFIAYIAANLLNTYMLTKWKFLLQGRKFI